VADVFAPAQLDNMGIFSRRAHPVDGNTTTTTSTASPTTHTGNGVHPVAHEKSNARRGGMLSGRNHGTYPDTLNSRPTFGQWVKGTWLDILTMVILGAIGLGVREITSWKCIASRN